jgi:opacity protein-like surface antigen
MRIATIVGPILSLLIAVPAFAQDDKRWHVNFGGGPTFALGDLGDRFNTGWGPAIGVTFDTSERVGIQFEYGYRRLYVEDSLDAQGGRLDAYHSMHQLTFNATADLTPRDAAIRPYVVAGPGMYYRSVSVTAYTGTGVICDPWYYVCGTYPIETILGSRGGWDFGFNVGGGLGFRFEGGEFFVETRYHYVWGPEITPATPTPVNTTPSTYKANGQYWPLTFGFRF